MPSERASLSMDIPKVQADRICKELQGNPIYTVFRWKLTALEADKVIHLELDRVSIIYPKSREIGLKRYLVEVLV